MMIRFIEMMRVDYLWQRNWLIYSQASSSSSVQITGYKRIGSDEGKGGGGSREWRAGLARWRWGARASWPIIPLCTTSLSSATLRPAFISNFFFHTQFSCKGRFAVTRKHIIHALTFTKMYVVYVHLSRNSFFSFCMCFVLLNWIMKKKVTKDLKGMEKNHWIKCL